MLHPLEELLISKFIVKNKRKRYLQFLSKEKSRDGFLQELYHFNDFKSDLFREIPGNENEIETIAEIAKQIKGGAYCLSINPDLDGKSFLSFDQLKDCIGCEGTILIFGKAEVIYYEGEPPHNRYISL